MPNGKAKKQLNERTNQIKQILSLRYHSLAHDLQLAKAGQLDSSKQRLLLEELRKPVSLSDTVLIQMDDCHPSTGRYKKALPKGYLKDITALEKSKNKKADSILKVDVEVQANLESEMPEPQKIDPELHDLNSQPEAGLDIPQSESFESALPQVELQFPTQDILNENMFLLIERYLAEPSTELELRIKLLSHHLTNQAYEDAKKKFPSKVKSDPLGRLIPNIGADEYSPILMDKMSDQAQEALFYSTRMIQNEQFDPLFYKTEKPCLFKLSRDEHALIKKVLGSMFNQKGKDALHPEGLVFAYDGYIERQSRGRIPYTENREAAAFAHNAKLYLKAQELAQRGELAAATILLDGCGSIKNELMSSKDEDSKMGAIKSILVDLQNNQTIQEHRGYLKSAITNFLLVISLVGAVYLGATSEKRGSFFYYPNTDTCNKVGNFESELIKLQSKL